MKKNVSASLYKGFRFPPEIISHCVWLYFRFSLSFRDIEELMAERGIVLTYETIRQWSLKFGQTYANELRRRRPKTGDKWHLDARVSHASTGRPTICGELSINMAMCLISWSRAGATNMPPKSSFASCSKD